MLQAQIFIDKDEYKGTQTLYEFIMEFLINQKINGATVFRGQVGFGSNQYMKRPNALFSFDEVPMMITFIDEDDKVTTAVKELRKHVKYGVVVTHKVEIWNND
jgi:PII-like signaling protein